MSATPLSAPIEPANTLSVRIWDLPTRIFHWALVVCIAGSFITVNLGGNMMPWHFRFGYCVFALLLFRVVWGLVGGRWSRFVSFIYGPSAILDYIQGRGKPEHQVGHNPLGAGSVFALLGFLLLQVASGLLSDDDIAYAGPLTKFVSNAKVSLATWYHKEIGSTVLVVLVLLHVAVIFFYLYKKKENLIHPMIHGNKKLVISVQPSRDDRASRAVAALVLGVCAALVWWVVRLGA
jgi:cytochrome b